MNYLDKIVFFDRNNDFIREVEKNLGQSIKIGSKTVVLEYTNCDVREFKENNVAFVSPANSFLLFNGGIDHFYGQMFPKLEADARQKIRNYPKITAQNQHYLPVGSAMVLPVLYNSRKKCYRGLQNIYVIASPTMYRPKRIVGTLHPYWCFLATLRVLEKFNRHLVDKNKCLKTLLVPGLGTGCGEITSGDASSQIKDAILRFNSPQVDNFDECPDDPIVYLTNQDEIDS